MALNSFDTIQFLSLMFHLANTPGMLIMFSRNVSNPTRYSGRAEIALFFSWFLIEKVGLRLEIAQGYKPFLKRFSIGCLVLCNFTGWFAIGGMVEETGYAML